MSAELLCCHEEDGRECGLATPLTSWDSIGDRSSMGELEELEVWQERKKEGGREGGREGERGRDGGKDVEREGVMERGRRRERRKESGWEGGREGEKVTQRSTLM